MATKVMSNKVRLGCWLLCCRHVLRTEVWTIIVKQRACGAAPSLAGLGVLRGRSVVVDSTHPLIVSQGIRRTVQRGIVMQIQGAGPDAAARRALTKANIVVPLVRALR